MGKHVIRVTANHWEVLQQGDVEEQRKTEEVLAQVVADATQALEEKIAAATREEEFCGYCGSGEEAMCAPGPCPCVLGVHTGKGAVDSGGGCGKQVMRIKALEAAGRNTLHHVRNALAPLSLAMQTPEGVAPAAHLFQELTADEIRACLGRVMESLANLCKVVDP